MDARLSRVKNITIAATVIAIFVVIFGSCEILLLPPVGVVFGLVFACPLYLTLVFTAHLSGTATPSGTLAAKAP